VVIPRFKRNTPASRRDFEKASCAMANAGTTPNGGVFSGGSRQRKVERAMGIEPTRAAPPELESKVFRAMTDPKCDWRANFRGMRGLVGILARRQLANV
jgi:hypothetical protein